MDKYVILLLLNLPFVLFGLLKVVMLYHTKSLSRIGFLSRILFWLIILAGLVFAQEIYNYLNTNGLTDSTPLSLADVILTTGVILCLTLCFRLYAKNDAMEKRLSDLHEKLSVYTSINRYEED
jgi:hypothetical protein